MKSCRILVGPSCNFSCSYCCNHLPGIIDKFETVSSGDYEKIIKDHDTINISGGEPLIPINLALTMEVVRLAKSYGKKVYLYTNLSKLPVEHLKELIESIDGWSVGIHEQSRMVPTNLTLIKALGAKSVRVLVEQSKAKEWIPLSDDIGIDVKPFVLDDCDISDREIWYKTSRAISY